jgi:alpha-galactosidase
LIGCDLTKIDDFTRDLLCNDEVIEVNQDPLGKVAQRISQVGEIEIWSRPLFDGTVAVAVFNRGMDDGKWSFKFADVGIDGTQPIRDLWKQKDYGNFNGNFAGTIPAHGSMLLKIGKPKE